MKKDNKRFYTGKREDHDAPDSDRKEDIPAFRHFSLVPTADFAVIEGGCYFGIRAGGTVVLFAAFARQACRRMIPPARRFVLAGDPDLLPACRAVRRVSPRGTFLLPLPGIRSKTTPIAAIRIERFP